MTSLLKNKSSKKQQTPLLSQNQLSSLKQAFADISNDVKSMDEQVRPNKFFETLSKLKTKFSQINSRQHDQFTMFATYIQIGKQIQKRPNLKKFQMTVNMIEVFALLTAIIIPKKLVNKTLLSLFVLTVQFQVVDKICVSYYVQSIALGNQMTEQQQQARNIIEYKYRIHPQCTQYFDSSRKRLSSDQNIKKLLEQIDKKNIAYQRFKKVSLLI